MREPLFSLPTTAAKLRSSIIPVFFFLTGAKLSKQSRLHWKARRSRISCECIYQSRQNDSARNSLCATHAGA